VAGSWEDDNKSSVSIKDREFLDCLIDYQFLKKDCVSWS
jgi:hypothetical protein